MGFKSDANGAKVLIKCMDRNIIHVDNLSGYLGIKESQEVFDLARELEITKRRLIEIVKELEGEQE